MDIHLSSCSIYLFQLAVQKILTGEESTVFQVHKLMQKLGPPLLVTALGRQTHLNLKVNSDIRRSMTYQILLRHVQSQEHVVNLHKL